MAPVGLKYVVSFSSQDDYHKIQNILNGDGFRKWLSHPKEKSGKIDAVFQLEEPCQLSYIDIGSYWCASIEIKVGRSDWPANTLYRTLVPTSALMTPAESKLSKGMVKTRMFNSENFVSDVADEKWDRIQVILRQPYRKDIQYGLSFIRLKTAGSKQGVNSSTKVKDASSSGSPAVKSVTSIQKHFFGSRAESSSNISPDPVKSRLMKLAGSGENGSEQGGVLSRTAKLVLSASDSAGKYSPQTRAGPSKSAKMSLFSEHLAQKYGSSFDEDVDEFLATLTKEDIDLDKVTMADLRHKFEKTKLRKLTVDEKKIFMEKCSDFICRMFDPDTQNTDVKSPKSYKKTTLKFHTTPTSCKRKLEDAAMSPKSSPIEGTSKGKVTAKKPDIKIPKTNNSTTLAPQRALISQVESAFKHGDVDRRVPFASRSPNVNNDKPKSSKKGKSLARKDSPKIETCGKWLSSNQGPEQDDADRTPKGLKIHNTPQSSRGRGRRKRGGRTENSDKRRDCETSSSGNYVYCSSCKGNVPEHIFSDHFIRCGGTDPPEHVNRSMNSTNTLATSQATPRRDHSPINISGDSDVIAEDSFNFVECPLCGEFFPSDVITVHADVCASAMEMAVL